MAKRAALRNFVLWNCEKLLVGRDRGRVGWSSDAKKRFGRVLVMRDERVATRAVADGDSGGGDGWRR